MRSPWVSPRPFTPYLREVVVAPLVGATPFPVHHPGDLIRSADINLLGSAVNTVEADVAALVVEVEAPPAVPTYDVVADFGAKADLKGPYLDGVTSPDGLTFTSAAATFVPADTGKKLLPAKGGVPATLTPTITYVNAHTVTFSVAVQAALQNQTGVHFYYGTDASPAFNAAGAAAHAAGGGEVTFTGRFFLDWYADVNDPVIGPNGYGCWIYDNVTYRGGGTGTELLCGHESSNPLFTYRTSGWQLIDFVVRGFACNVGGIKPVDSSRAWVERVGIYDCRIAHDLLTMKDTDVVDCWSEATAEITTVVGAAGDTRGLSIADNDIATGQTDGVRVTNYRSKGYYIPLRVVNSTALPMRGIQLTNIQGYGVAYAAGVPAPPYAGTYVGLSIEQLSTGAVEVTVDGVDVRTATYGCQVLNTTGVQIDRMRIDDTLRNGLILWAARQSRINTRITNYNTGDVGAAGIQVGDTGGVGSTGNVFEDCAATKATGVVYSYLEFGTLTGRNEIRGGQFSEYLDVKPTTRVDTTVSGNVRLVKVGVSPSAQAVVDNDTVYTLNTDAVWRIAPAAARTGGILGPGNYEGQRFTVRNEAASANTWTFAAVGTSHVFGGAAVAIAGGAERTFEWWASDSLWHPL